AIALIMIFVGMVQGKYLKTTFFPSFSRSNDFDVGLVLTPGTREAETERILKDLEQKVLAISEEISADRTDGRQMVVNTRLSLGSAASQSGSHTGIVKVELLPEEVRNMDKFRATALFRKKLGTVPEAEQFTVGESRRFFGSPVSISLKSRDSEELEGAKNLIKKALVRRGDLKDITDNNVAGKREINMKLKPQAYVLGLTHNDITRQIRQGFFGEEVQRLQIGEDEVRVWVRYPEENRKSLGELEGVKIKTDDGREFPLTDLIEYDTERGVVSITHLNGAKEIRVEADLADSKNPVQPILQDIRENLIPQMRAQFPSVISTFEGQARQGDRFAGSFLLAVPLLLIGIFLLITLEFRSFSQSFLIILMIPLGILGAAIGHWIEAKPLSILSSYGIVALSGVIVNDAVVFQDKFNRLLKSGHKVATAIFFAGKSRFRPIILTSLTTVVGLFPLIRDTSTTARFLVPMAISVAYGVLLGTFFILTVFPALIVIANDVRVGIGYLWSLVWGEKLKLPGRTSVEPSILEDKKLERIL
ncbi:MAG: efflux RND transporter permease subunit, partial [Bacteroidota bacterium]